MKRKKVLFLITKSNWGGAQRYVFDLATHLPADRFEIAVALGGDGPLVAKLTDAHIRVIHIPGLQRDVSLTKELLAARAIAHVLDQERPDILHVNSSKAGLIGALLGRIYRVPRVIFTAHAWAFNEDRPLPIRLVFGYLHWLTILFAHQTITASEALKREMRWPCVAHKMHTIHHGRTIPAFLDKVDARQELIKYVPALAPYAHDCWSGTIAELHPVKRHDVMIEAVAALRANGITLRHVIISGGELRTHLESLVTRHGLTDQIFFAGAIDEAARLLPAFDIFTFTSRSEALGYAAIEAAQAGLPIVASNVGGIPEIITDGVEGILVPTGDVPAVTTALTTLITNPTQAAHFAAAAKIKSEQFTMERMVAKTVACYIPEKNA